MVFLKKILEIHIIIINHSLTLIKSQLTSYRLIELQCLKEFCLDHLTDLEQSLHQVWIEVVQLTKANHVLHRNATDSNNRLIDLQEKILKKKIKSNQKVNQNKIHVKKNSVYTLYEKIMNKSKD